MPTPEQSTSAAAPAAAALPSSSIVRPQRVLACVMCQQRKVKCDRKFPCGNCVKSHVECVPSGALAPRQRRRRFPERELLDRIRRYESLLHQHNIQFEPLHKDFSTTVKQPHNAAGGGGYDSPDDDQKGPAVDLDGSLSPSTIGKPDPVNKSKNLWEAIIQGYLDSDDESSDSKTSDVRGAVVEAWHETFQNDEQLLFGSRKTADDLSILHPEQVQIFRLWQIYLNNVNPLLKVTHTPTLQGRIIDAASNLATIKPTMAALMFSIYCVSIESLVDDECRTIFGSPKEHLLVRFQFSCQQALLACGFLRTSDRECLTALYLYLISVRPSTNPQSLSSILGLAIRIAQRMGLHSESAYAKSSVFEAEMGRRLWWALIVFDARICEMSDHKSKSTMLVPTWDCRTPLNINDFDLQPDMKDAPAVQGKSTEALFAVVRCEMADFVRHSAFHMASVDMASKTATNDVQNSRVTEGEELATLEKMIQDKYLKFCNPENPLHFMTIWMARAYVAKNRLIEIYSGLSSTQADAQRDANLSHALDLLECDTKLMTSPLTKGYTWLIRLYFPFPAYMYIVQDLRRRPVCDHAERAWEIMSDSYEARSMPLEQIHNPFYRLFTKIILQAWEAREALFSQSENSLMLPGIVSDIKRKVAQPTHDAHNANFNQPSNVLGNDDFSMSMPMDFGGQGMLFGMGVESYEGLGSGHGRGGQDIDVNQLDWSAMDWNPMHGRGW